MKKITLVIFTLLLAALMLVSCAAPQAPAASSSAAAPSQAATPTPAPAASSAASSSAAPSSAAPTPAPAKVYKIALSNSFMGNDWRQEMEKVVQVVSTKSPYKEKVKFDIVNCDNTPEAQSASIDALVQQKYDAILVDAASATALNPSLQRALDAGIVVVSFDQIVDLEGTYGVDTDWTKVPKAMAQYLASTLKGKGNIVVDRGLPGAPISKQLYDGATAVFKNYPDIKIVGEYDGQYAEGPSEQGMASILATNPQIDAVYTQGYITPIVRAFKAAKRTCVPMSGFAYNGSVLALVDEKVGGIIANNLPGLGAMALKTAVEVLEGKKPAKTHIVVDPTFLVTDTSIDLTVGVTGELIKEGTNCFRDMPSGFDWPVLPADFGVTVTAEEVVVKK